MESHVVDGNRLTLLTEGPARLDALVALIEGARESLRIIYYIYADDESGRRVNAALLDAAARGVRVALIVDGFGSDAAARQHFFDPLAAAGISVHWFMPRFGRRYLLRNHQKLALADEARILIGGFNIANAYFAADDAEAWRDLGLLVEGPAAAWIARYFDALDTWVATPPWRTRRLSRVLARWSETEGAVRWLIGGPTLRPSRLVLTLRDDMRDARRLDMIMAYFAPNPALLRRLARIARRGAARIVTAARSDNRVTIGAARHCYYRLLKGGVAVCEYQPAKLHEKLIAIDDIGYVGSANFDMRSLYLNLELMLRVEDARFADAVRGRIGRAAQRSDRIDWDRYRELATPWRKMVWTIHYFIVAVLDFGVSRGLNVKG